MASDSVVSSDQISIEVSGDLGDVSAAVATPLAVTLAELLQNAVEHAFVREPDLPGDDLPGDDQTGDDRAGGDLDGTGGARGHVQVLLRNAGEELVVEVRDDGCGLPPGFDIEKTTSLGLSIVRDLVMTQLSGSIIMERVPVEEGNGTRVVIAVPWRAAGR
jgi:two-component system, sensor histidine kinase PdtaS